MANMTKYTAGGACGVLRHDTRKEGENYTRKNIEIDSTRTHLNYTLTTSDCGTEPITFIKNFADENNINMIKRKDLNVMVSWIVTMPTGENGITPAEQERFFFEVNRFLSERYGFSDKNEKLGNILSSVVHLDETTPHLHFCFIPVAYDSKNHRNTISAKLVCSRKDLITFHKDLTVHMKLVFGRDIGILNGQTEPVKNVAELKAKGGKLERKVETAEKRLQVLSDKAQAHISHANDSAREIIRKAKETAQSDAQAILSHAIDNAEEITRFAQERADELYRGADEYVKQSEEKAIKFLETKNYKIADEWKTVRKIGNPLKPRARVDYVNAPLSYIENMCNTANKHIDRTAEIDELREKLEKDKVKALADLQDSLQKEIGILKYQVERLTEERDKKGNANTRLASEVSDLKDEVDNLTSKCSFFEEKAEKSEKILNNFKNNVFYFLRSRDILDECRSYCKFIQSATKFHCKNVSSDELILAFKQNKIPCEKIPFSDGEKFVGVPSEYFSKANQIFSQLEHRNLYSERNQTLDLTQGQNRGLHR